MNMHAMISWKKK